MEVESWFRDSEARVFEVEGSAVSTQMRDKMFCAMPSNVTNAGEAERSKGSNDANASSASD